jgi:hypothetical protein
MYISISKTSFDNISFHCFIHISVLTYNDIFSVDMITGRPCIDFLDDYSKWEEEYSLSFILVTIQVRQY